MAKFDSENDMGQPLQEVPAYGLKEAAHYLQIPVTTLRSWVAGRYYETETGRILFKPLVITAQKDPYVLSFINLVEVHVLNAIRRQHHISVKKIRSAIAYLSQESQSIHPLADHAFETDGMNLFIQKYGQLINISQAGQLAMKELLKTHLRRIERDTSGFPVKLYLFTRGNDLKKQPKAVVIDPRISFGRPVLSGTGISTSLIAERFWAGESVEELAEDYGLTLSQIQEAIRCESFSSRDAA
jgi:uncharacterized protein (DUF433 family)